MKAMSGLMVNRKMIQRGLAMRKISIEDEFGGCIDICCRIGDNAFYFAEQTDQSLSAEEFLKIYTTDEIVDMLFDVLKDVESAERNGIDCEELAYYRAVLLDQ